MWRLIIHLKCDRCPKWIEIAANMDIKVLQKSNTFSSLSSGGQKIGSWFDRRARKISMKCSKSISVLGKTMFSMSVMTSWVNWNSYESLVCLGCGFGYIKNWFVTCLTFWRKSVNKTTSCFMIFSMSQKIILKRPWFLNLQLNFEFLVAKQKKFWLNIENFNELKRAKMHFCKQNWETQKWRENLNFVNKARFACLIMKFDVKNIDLLVHLIIPGDITCFYLPQKWTFFVVTCVPVHLLWSS